MDGQLRARSLPKEFHGEVGALGSEREEPVDWKGTREGGEN